MQTKHDSSFKIEQRILNANFSIDNEALTANVGFALINLAKHFSKATKANADILITEEEIEAYLKSLSKKVAKEEEAVQKAWAQVSKKLQEPIHGILDVVHYWQDGKDFRIVIDLKTSLALIYAALTDKETYWQEALM